VLRLKDGAIVQEDVPALSSLNMRLRDDFVADAAQGIARWNRVLERAGVAFRIRLPHVAFNRRIGEFAVAHADADGTLLDAAVWEARKDAMLPTVEDYRFVESLMRPVRDRGTYAGWIAPPRIGIDNKPGDFEYVRLE
jgi:benzoyl-CoA 2,3-epoxidase subunit B